MNLRFCYSKDELEIYWIVCANQADCDSLSNLYIPNKLNDTGDPDTFAVTNYMDVSGDDIFCLYGSRTKYVDVLDSEIKEI